MEMELENTKNPLEKVTISSNENVIQEELVEELEISTQLTPIKEFKCFNSFSQPKPTFIQPRFPIF